MPKTVGWVLMLCVLTGCHSTPTENVAVGGTFPLARWNDLALPVDLGFTPPGTCGRAVTSGTLTLDATAHHFSYTVHILNCHGLDEGSSQVDGTFVQSGDALDVTILGTSYIHIYGTILPDRIVITNGQRLEFTRGRS